MRDLRARIAIFRFCSLDERELAAWLLGRLTTPLNAVCFPMACRPPVHTVFGAMPYGPEGFPRGHRESEKTGSDLLADRVCVPQLLLSSNRINQSLLSSALRILLQGKSSIKLEFRLARVAKWQTQQTQNLPRLTLMSVRVRPRAPLFIVNKPLRPDRKQSTHRA